MTSQYDVLVALAAENHGLVTTADAFEAGVPAVTLRKLRASGRVERIAQGLYRVIALPASRLTPFMEAVLWSSRRGAISHASALEMLELCDVIPRRIHLTVPASCNPRRADGNGYRVHRHDLTDRDLTLYDGVPVVTAYRAILQATADGENPDQLRTAVRNAARHGLLLRAEGAHLLALLK